MEAVETIGEQQALAGVQALTLVCIDAKTKVTLSYRNNVKTREAWQAENLRKFSTKNYIEYLFKLKNNNIVCVVTLNAHCI